MWSAVYNRRNRADFIAKVKFMRRFERDAGYLQMNIFGERHFQVEGKPRVIHRRKEKKTTTGRSRGFGDC